MRVKLSKWAKNNGVTYRTAYQYFIDGRLDAIQLETGTILVLEEKKENIKSEKNVIYCRESSSENKVALDNQVERCSNFCAAKGWVVDRIVKEIGSGLNDKRQKFLEIIEDDTISRIIVEHKDRFCRFGLEPIKRLLLKQNKELFIINEADSNKEDLIQDFISIITSFCARVYGQRRTKKATEKLIRELEKNESC
jgi:putative resolvase